MAIATADFVFKFKWETRDDCVAGFLLLRNRIEDQETAFSFEEGGEPLRTRSLSIVVLRGRALRERPLRLP